MRELYPQGHTELVAAAFAASIPFGPSRNPIYDKIAEFEDGTNIPPFDYIPPELQEDYMNWWTSADSGEVYDRLQLVQNYETNNYGALTEKLRAETATLEEPAQHPDFMFYTPMARHYRHTSKKAGNLMIRLINDPVEYSHENNPGAQVTAVEEHIDGLRRGLGYIMAEQVKGYSYTDAAIISEAPKGKPMMQLEAHEVSKEDVNNLLDHVENLQQLGIEPDLDAISLWHNNETGFHLFNYSSHQIRMSRPLKPTEVADELTLRAFGTYPTEAMGNICGFISHVAKNRH